MRKVTYLIITYHIFCQLFLSDISVFTISFKLSLLVLLKWPILSLLSLQL